MSAQGQGSFVGKKVEVVQVHGDLSQEVVQITVDRLSLILHKHAGALARRGAWLPPAGILASFIATLVTCEFKDWLVPAATWNALFVLVAILSAGWLFIAVAQALRAPSVEGLVDRIKTQRVN